MTAHDYGINNLPLRRGLSVIAVFGLSVASLLFMNASQGANSGRWHDIDDIRQAAERVAGVPGAQAMIDSRVRMLACSGALQAKPTSVSRRAGSSTVQVSCGAPQWSLYVPVKADAQQTVVVLARSMGRGEVINRADLHSESRPAGQGYAYITSIDAIVGQRLTRPAAKGTALTPAWLDAPIMVSRGQEVTVLAAAGGLKIRTRGEALSDGSLADRIRVRNLSSGRVIEAIILSAETVEVGF